jgi:hypothetical protein
MTMKVDKLADNFYTVTGMNGSGRTGGAIGVLTGPDGIFMVDASFGPLTGKVTAAIKTFSNEPIRFLVNTHSHGDHTGGNPNFAMMGATILARPELRRALEAQKGFDPAGLPLITYTSPLALHMDGEEVVLTPVPPAHTDGDTIGVNPSIETVFCPHLAALSFVNPSPDTIRPFDTQPHRSAPKVISLILLAGMGSGEGTASESLPPPPL